MSTKPRRRTRPKGRVVDPEALRQVRELLGEAPRRRDLLIEHLHRIQDSYGPTSAAHLVALAHEMGLAQTQVYEVATFCHHFDLVKEGAQSPPPLTVRVCDSVSCAMAGAEPLIRELQGALGDGVRIQRVPCVGCCEQAPVAVVGRNPVPRATAEAVQAQVRVWERRSRGRPPAEGRGRARSSRPTSTGGGWHRPRCGRVLALWGTQRQTPGDPGGWLRAQSRNESEPPYREGDRPPAADGALR